MNILLIRHAESIANTQGIYQGQTCDTNLSHTGKKQAETLAKTLAKLTIDIIYTSPLKRNIQTAQIISERLLLPAPTLDNRLIEINHGQWEGKTKEQVEIQFPGQIKTWKTNPEAITMPDGEHINQVYDRAMDFLNEITQQKFSRVAIVTHDAVIRVLLTKLLRRELKDLWLYKLDSACYSVLEWNGKFKQVAKINENEHLNGIAGNLSTHAL